MNTYISLLRGINVSGHKMIKMEDLINLYKSLKFENVRTYVQSGNVIFNTSARDQEKILKKLETNIESRFGFPVKVIIRTHGELYQVIKKNPFIKRTGIDISKLYISFLSDKPAAGLIKDIKLNKNETEEYQIIGKEVYLYLPEGYGNTKLQIGIFEKKLNVIATARNWKTVNTLYEFSNEK
jgi:uncharacterized protein (DUF1697 family)